MANSLIIGFGTMGKLIWSPVLSTYVSVDPVSEHADYKTLEEALSHYDERPDAAVVCTPDETHFEIVKALLEESIPVMCEKPLTTTYKEARILVDLAMEQKTSLCVSYQRRSSKTYDLLKKIAKDYKKLNIGYRYLGGSFAPAGGWTMDYGKDWEGRWYHPDIQATFQRAYRFLVSCAGHSLAFIADTSGGAPVTVTHAEYRRATQGHHFLVELDAGDHHYTLEAGWDSTVMWDEYTRIRRNDEELFAVQWGIPTGNRMDAKAEAYDDILNHAALADYEVPKGLDAGQNILNDLIERDRYRVNYEHWWESFIGSLDQHNVDMNGAYVPKIAEEVAKWLKWL